MKLIKQRASFNIINLDKIMKLNSQNKKCIKRHGSLLPNNIRCIVCGPSNCGKTNVMLNLLFSPHGLHFKNVYVFSKSLNQPKYKFLKCVMKNIEDVGLYMFSDNDEVLHPADINPNSVMIFDDVACEKQQNIKNYFSMGRHNNIDTFYICQTYSYIPKQLVRDNANLIILFKQDYRNLQHIYNDHVNTDMSFDKFKEICANVWHSGKNEFVVIDKDSEMAKGRYRKGLDVFIHNP